MKNKIKRAFVENLPVDIEFQLIVSGEPQPVEYKAFRITEYDETTGFFKGYEERDIKQLDLDKIRNGEVKLIVSINLTSENFQ